LQCKVDGKSKLEATMTDDGGPAGPDDSHAARDEPGAGSDPERERPVADSDATASPEQLLGAAKAARQQARRTRHGYWFPLVLFGLLASASSPFYLHPEVGKRSCLHALPGHICRVRGTISAGPVPQLGSGYLGGIGVLAVRSGSAYYWLAAMLAGLVATAVWYRLRGDRVGLRTPSRGFVITGMVLLVLALLIPVLAAHTGSQLAVLMPGDLLVRGTFPLVLIGLALCVLAWAERSVALTVIAAGYLALSLVASLYDIGNVLYRLGWEISPVISSLPNVVLPALVLLLSGASAWVVQRQQRPRSAASSDSGNIAGQSP
jgi:hypothetical protein